MKDWEYTKANAKVWDEWSSEAYEWTTPISHEAYLEALSGAWDIMLTPVKKVPKEWFPPLRGIKALGLAAGGGQQMPMLASQGAICTLLDISKVQRDYDRMVAEREGYAIEILDGDMSKAFPFADGSFDLIVHPESNNWIRDVRHLWRECFRVLKPGGVLVAGFANPLLYLFEGDETQDDLRVANALPYDPIATLSEEELAAMAKNSIQFSHSLESQLGGQLEAGLRLTHLYEDVHHEGALAKFAPAFIATRAVKP